MPSTRMVSMYARNVSCMPCWMRRRAVSAFHVDSRNSGNIVTLMTSAPTPNSTNTNPVANTRHA